MDLEFPPLSMTVVELQSRWPQTIPVFIKHRMSCVGCGMSTFDTIEDVLRVYRLSQDTFLGELREAVAGME